ncbi:DUF726-domain-containing protein [Xylariaceae sp. FL0804]|nr:DUF726-domain-containing protein [Xylariaceae sp. FL0804]
MDSQPSCEHNSSSGDDRDDRMSDKDKMPRPEPVAAAAPKGKMPTPHKRPELDLSRMLSHDQHKQLSVLMNAILDDMQTQINNTFLEMKVIDVKDPFEGIDILKPMVLSVPNPRSEKYRAKYGDIGLSKDKIDINDTEQLRKSMKPVDPPKSSNPELRLPKSIEEHTQNTGWNSTEIAIRSQEDLRKEAESHFRKWRNMVSKRLLDIVIIGPGTPGNVTYKREEYVPGNARRTGNASRGRPARPPPGLPTGFATQSNAAWIKHYPPMYTMLLNGEREKRALILHSMLLMMLGLDQYTSYARAALLKLATALHVPAIVLLQDELRISQALAQIVKGISAEEVAQRRAEEGKPPKRWRGSGLPSAVSPAFSGVLAQPLVDAGVGTVFTGLGYPPHVAASLLGGVGAAESTVPVGTLFGLYGARQGGKAMDAYAKEIQDFALTPMHGSMQTELRDPKDVPAENRRMRVTIAVSGWTTPETGYKEPWRFLSQYSEVYALKYETEALEKLGTQLRALVKTQGWTEAKKVLHKRSVFDRLKESDWPLELHKNDKNASNAWKVAMTRSFKAGEVLAELLINRVQGERPVTLIGFTFGAYVIYKCLMTLAEKKAFGIIDNVVMMGAPCSAEVRNWAGMRSVVGGRLVNVYSTKDYLGGFLYREGAWLYGVAGLQKIDYVPRVENYDVSDTVSNHTQWQYLSGSILKRLGWEDIDYDQIAVDTNKMDEMTWAESKMDMERAERAVLESNEHQAKAIVDRARMDFERQMEEEAKKAKQAADAGPDNRELQGTENRDKPKDGPPGHPGKQSEQAQPRTKTDSKENRRPGRRGGRREA